jgi:nitrite reductase (NADH) small subunit
METALEWRNVGSLDDLPARGARRLCFGIKHSPIAVFRTGDDAVYALIDVCPHRAGPLSEGIVAGATVTCPLHNWTIRLDDGNAVAPDEGTVRTVPVKIVDRTIYIGIPVAASVEA